MSFQIKNGVLNRYTEEDDVTEVTIPNGITRIESLAFQHCHLKTVVIPESVTEISSEAFHKCYHLQNVVISEGLTEIGDLAFNGCISLENIVIPEGVTKIGDYAFWNCYHLKNVVLPNSVREIGESAFVGGRWVLDKNLSWVKEKFDGYADGFSLGCPDDDVTLFADTEKWHELEAGKQYQHPFYHLDYTILHNYRHYQPVLEISRGCGCGCSFCLEKDFRVCPLVSPEIIFRQIAELERLYGTKNLNIYFESSVFLPTVEWSREFERLYRENHSRFQWRCTTRVDITNIEAFSILAESGLKVIDFGLESASPTQLLKMHKTNNSKRYLQKAEKLFTALSEKGIWK